MEINQIAVVIGAFGLFGLAAFFLLAPANSQKAIRGRSKKLMEKYSRQDEFKLEASLKKKQKDAMVSHSIISMPSISKLRNKLDRTGKEITLLQYLLGSIGVLIVSALLFKFAFGFPTILTILLAILSGILIPNIVVNRWEFQRMKKFMLILPDAIDLIIRGLRSGLPVTESVNVIRDEIPEPVKSVFGEIGQSVRIGVPFEEALMQSAKKLQLNEFNFFVISVALQRETGGNLAEILDNLSTTIRARAMMKLKIKAITSEARMSAYIVGALPFLVSLALTFLQPGYLTPLVEDVRGNIALIGASCSFVFGMFIMFKMARFEI